MADGAQENLLAQLKALHDTYATGLPEKVSQIHSGLDTLRSGWDDELLRTLHRQVHSLTGSGATFGYAEVSDTARKLEQLLKQLSEMNAGSGHVWVQQIEPLLSALEQASQTSMTDVVTAVSTLSRIQPRIVAHPENEPRLIFVVDDDTSLAREQCLQYKLHGYEVSEFHDFNGLKEAVRKDRPQAIIMDVIFPEGDLAGIQKIADLRQDFEDFPPVIFVSQREDLKARLASVRAGAAAYFTKPLDLSGVIETLDRLTTYDQGEPYRVLVVDDDESLACHNALILQRAGMETRVLADASHILELLADFQPELILMDLYMPMCTGIELAAVIRQQEAYVGTPIVFFSVETDVATHLDAMRAGGDDFLIKSITPDHLLATVEARVRRARTLTSLMVRDGLTGLLNQTSIEEQLVRELGLQVRQGGELSYAMIDLDHFKQVNDRYGHAAGDRVLRGLSRLLRQRFRQTDLLGRYGGEEFVAVLPATDVQLAARLLDEVRVAFSRIQFTGNEKPFSVTFSAGVASAPPFQDAVTLQGEADRALYRAKQAGRNQVCIVEKHQTSNA